MKHTNLSIYFAFVDKSHQITSTNRFLKQMWPDTFFHFVRSHLKELPTCLHLSLNWTQNYQTQEQNNVLVKKIANCLSAACEFSVVQGCGLFLPSH